MLIPIFVQSNKRRVKAYVAVAATLLALQGCNPSGGNKQQAAGTATTANASGPVLAPEPTGANKAPLVVLSQGNPADHAALSSITALTPYLTGTSAADVQIKGLDSVLAANAPEDQRFVINLTGVVSLERPASDLKSTYTHQGAIQTKQFKPLERKPVFTLRPDAQLNILFDLMFKNLKGREGRLAGFVLYHEPYANGVTKADLERGIKALRTAMKKAGADQVPVGVNFAGAFFNKGFATLVQDTLGEYVHGIDQYYQQGSKDLASLPEAERKAFPDWLKTIQTNRLSTYDLAGNMYAEGGLPQGLDEVSFDFFLAKQLLDTAYDRTPQWFANTQKIAACAPFKDKDMKAVKQSLSFLQDGALPPNALDADRLTLNQLFECRMTGALTLLSDEVAKYGKPLKVSMVMDLTSNAIAERDSKLSLEADQPPKLLEGRILDEAKRYLSFADRQTDRITGNLYVLQYPSNKDASGKVVTLGVEALPDVQYVLKQRNLPANSKK